MLIIQNQSKPRALTVSVVSVLLLVMSGLSASAFEEDFHYYAVYYILRAKGYPTNAAHELSGFSQYVDDNHYTEPLWCPAPRRAHFHFADSGPETAAISNCVTARINLTNTFSLYLSGRKNGKYMAGAALHLMADTFSHQQFTAWWNYPINHRTDSMYRSYIGHADDKEGGHFPDRPYNNPSVALGAALAIYTTIPDWPGGTVLPWSTLQAGLDPVFASPAKAGEDRAAIKIRIKAMKDLIHRQFGETASYDKKEFGQDCDAFIAAVKW